MELTSGSSAEALKDPVREKKESRDCGFKAWGLDYETWVQIHEGLPTNPAASAPQPHHGKYGHI